MPRRHPDWLRRVVRSAYREIESTPRTAEFIGDFLGINVSQSWVWGVCDEVDLVDENPSYDDALKERARQLVDEGYSQRETARILQAETGRDGPSHEWVNKYTESDAGYERLGRRKITYQGSEIELRGRHTVETCRAVLDGYAAGETPSDLSDEHDVPISTIENWAERAGIIRNSKEARINYLISQGRVSPIARRRKVEQLYTEKKLSINQIADLFDVSPAVVRDDLVARDVDLRDRATGLILHHWGSIENYKKFCREVYVRVSHKDEAVTSVADDYDVSHHVVRKAMRKWKEFLASAGSAGGVFHESQRTSSNQDDG